MGPDAITAAGYRPFLGSMQYGSYGLLGWELPPRPSLLPEPLGSYDHPKFLAGPVKGPLGDPLFGGGLHELGEKMLFPVGQPGEKERLGVDPVGRLALSVRAPRPTRPGTRLRERTG